MTEEIVRSAYSVREAFLADLRAARGLGQLRDASAFWALVEELARRPERDTSQDTVIEELGTTIQQLQARIAALEETIATGERG